MLERFCLFSICLIAPSIANGSTAEAKIAILDSGCNIEYEEGVSFVDGTPGDLNGHGTEIAKIIKQTNPNAKLYVAKVFSQYAHTVDITPLVKALYWAISHQVDLINVSWETHTDHKAIHDAIQEAYNQDIVVVAPAGNKGDPLDVLIDELCYRGQKRGSTVKYPAKYDEVIAIGAITSFWRFTRHPKYSAIGPEVEFVCDGSYGSRKGTSFAAARATAIIAKIKADHPDLDGARLREILESYTRDLGDKGRDTKFGYGKLEYNPQELSDQTRLLGLADVENREQRGRKPSLSVGRIAGEIIYGELVASNAMVMAMVYGQLAGLGVAILVNEVTPVDREREPAIVETVESIFAIPGWVLGSSLGVYKFGNRGNETGSFSAAFWGSVLGAGVAIPGFFLVGNRYVQIFFTMLPPIGATIGFNTTHRYNWPPAGSDTPLVSFENGQMSVAVPTVYFRPDCLGRGGLSQSADLLRVRF